MTDSFRQTVESLVGQVPRGSVVTYGQLAILAGRPAAARAVGGLAHFGRSDLPWHRVVNSRGGLANGYPGGRQSHYQHLRSEGIVFQQVSPGAYQLNLQDYQWRPSSSQIRKLVSCC